MSDSQGVSGWGQPAGELEVNSLLHGNAQPRPVNANQQIAELVRNGAGARYAPIDWNSEAAAKVLDNPGFWEPLHEALPQTGRNGIATGTAELWLKQNYGNDAVNALRRLAEERCRAADVPYTGPAAAELDRSPGSPAPPPARRNRLRNSLVAITAALTLTAGVATLVPRTETFVVPDPLSESGSVRHIGDAIQHLRGEYLPDPMPTRRPFPHEPEAGRDTYETAHFLGRLYDNVRRVVGGPPPAGPDVTTGGNPGRSTGPTGSDGRNRSPNTGQPNPATGGNMGGNTPADPRANTLAVGPPTGGNAGGNPPAGTSSEGSGTGSNTGSRQSRGESPGPTPGGSSNQGQPGRNSGGTDTTPNTGTTGSPYRSGGPGGNTGGPGNTDPIHNPETPGTGSVGGGLGLNPSRGTAPAGKAQGRRDAAVSCGRSGPGSRLSREGGRELEKVYPLLTAADVGVWVPLFNALKAGVDQDDQTYASLVRAEVQAAMELCIDLVTPDGGFVGPGHIGAWNFWRTHDPEIRFWETDGNPLYVSQGMGRILLPSQWLDGSTPPGDAEVAGVFSHLGLVRFSAPRNAITTRSRRIETGCRYTDVASLMQCPDDCGPSSGNRCETVEWYEYTCAGHGCPELPVAAAAEMQLSAAARSWIETELSRNWQGARVQYGDGCIEINDWDDTYGSAVSRGDGIWVGGPGDPGVWEGRFYVQYPGPEPVYWHHDGTLTANLRDTRPAAE